MGTGSSSETSGTPPLKGGPDGAGEVGGACGALPAGRIAPELQRTLDTRAAMFKAYLGEPDERPRMPGNATGPAGLSGNKRGSAKPGPRRQRDGEAGEADLHRRRLLAARELIERYQQDTETAAMHHPTSDPSYDVPRPAAKRWADSDGDDAASAAGPAADARRPRRPSTSGTRRRDTAAFCRQAVSLLEKSPGGLSERRRRRVVGAAVARLLTDQSLTSTVDRTRLADRLEEAAPGLYADRVRMMQRDGLTSLPLTEPTSHRLVHNLMAVYRPYWRRELRLETATQRQRLDLAIACYVGYAMSIRDVLLAERSDEPRPAKVAAAHVRIRAAALPLLKQHDQIMTELAGDRRAPSFHMHAAGPVAVQVNEAAAAPAPRRVAAAAGGTVGHTSRGLSGESSEEVN